MGRRQLQIAGTERETDAELDEIAGPYVAALYQRMDLQKQESQLLAQLRERMIQKKLPLYVFYDEDDNGFDITAEPGEVKVKVKRHAKPDAKEEGDGGDAG